MGCRNLYWCDICSTEYINGSRELKENAFENLLGIRFLNNTEITVGRFDITEGKHICRCCAIQLKAELERINLKD